AERLFVIGDAVALDERDEVALRVAAERRDAEMRVSGEKILRAGVDVGEVAAPAARDADLLSGSHGMVDDQNRAAALARFDRAHHAGGTCTDHNNIEPGQLGFAPLSALKIMATRGKACRRPQTNCLRSPHPIRAK